MAMTSTCHGAHHTKGFAVQPDARHVVDVSKIDKTFFFRLMCPLVLRTFAIHTTSFSHRTHQTTPTEHRTGRRGQ
jgi:hypothetical protein